MMALLLPGHTHPLNGGMQQMQASSSSARCLSTCAISEYSSKKTTNAATFARAAQACLDQIMLVSYQLLIVYL